MRALVILSFLLITPEQCDKFIVHPHECPQPEYYNDEYKDDNFKCYR